MPELGQIVAKKSLAEGEIVIRYPREGDAPALLEYINALSREQTFILLQGVQLTLEQEEDWLRGRLAAIADGTDVTLAAVLGERVVGITHIMRKLHAESHVGLFGISVAEDFRGQGVGTVLLQSVIAEAETHLSGLRIIELRVFANNPVAINLYRNHGFVECGRLPGGALRRGEYVDHIHMYKPMQADP